LLGEGIEKPECLSPRTLLGVGTRQYGPHAFYFESFAAVFRLLLCGGLNVWFDENSATGVVATLIVSILALWFGARLKPFAGCRARRSRGVARRLCGSRVR